MQQISKSKETVHFVTLLSTFLLILRITCSTSCLLWSNQHTSTGMSNLPSLLAQIDPKWEKSATIHISSVHFEPKTPRFFPFGANLDAQFDIPAHIQHTTGVSGLAPNQSGSDRMSPNLTHFEDKLDSPDTQSHRLFCQFCDQIIYLDTSLNLYSYQLITTDNK